MARKQKRKALYEVASPGCKGHAVSLHYQMLNGSAVVRSVVNRCPGETPEIILAQIAGEVVVTCKGRAEYLRKFLRGEDDGRDDFIPKAVAESPALVREKRMRLRRRLYDRDAEKLRRDTTFSSVLRLLKLAPKNEHGVPIPSSSENFPEDLRGEGGNVKEFLYLMVNGTVALVMLMGNHSYYENQRHESVGLLMGPHGPLHKADLLRCVEIPIKRRTHWMRSATRLGLFKPSLTRPDILGESAGRRLEERGERLNGNYNKVKARASVALRRKRISDGTQEYPWVQGTA